MRDESSQKKKNPPLRSGGMEKQNLPPWPATTPRLTSGRANFASRLAMTKSQFNIISTPPPYAPPITAAIIGLQDWRREIEPNPCILDSILSVSLLMPLCWSAFHLARSCLIWNKKTGIFSYAIRSAPAQNSRPAPVTMTTLRNC